ncbi:MAG: N-acetylmuramoyl-L-alanine amidase [Desulfuromonadales bacterium]|nr:N-acetylmuramoyl-L-alanine amidase [Desulfuromonadales bacterium]
MSRPSFQIKKIVQILLRLQILLLLLLVVLTGPAAAVVEIGRPGQEPLVIEDVYLREGSAFISIDDVLGALELEGAWDSVAHVYSIRTPHGRATISPGSQFLKIGDNFIPISHRPRFIDGKLRVSETFLLSQLAPLLTEPLHYRNHNPPAPQESDSPLDRLFSFLLRKKEPVAESSKWIVAIDPGHGGEDTGALAPDGSKEKGLTLAVAQRLGKLLKMHQDAPVILTRDGDYALKMEQRLELVAKGESDVLLSLHAQASFNSEPSGMTLYVQPQTERDAPDSERLVNESVKLAETLLKKLRAAGFVVHGIVQTPVYPLGRGDLPRVLVEMGSLTNEQDLAMLHDPMRQQDIARALFDGLKAYFDSHTETTSENHTGANNESDTSSAF